MNGLILIAVIEAMLPARLWQRSCTLCLVCCVTAAQLIVLPATAKPLAQNASAEQIRSIHTDASQKAWRLIYRAQDQSPIEFVVWQDYATLKMDDKSTIFDFKLKRLIRLGEDGNRFFHSSLHASVGFRDLEFQHRSRLARAFENTNETISGGRTIFDAFWRASDLGYMREPVSLRGAELSKQPNGSFTITYKGEAAFEFQPAAPELDDRHSATFYRILRHMLPAHPIAHKLMSENGHPPATLRFLKLDVEQPSERRWSLESIEQLNLDYPLRNDSRPDFQLLLDESGLSPGFLRRFGPSLRDVVSDKTTGAISGWKNYRDLAQDLISDGKRFDAGLLTMEYMIRYRPCQRSLPSCSGARELLRSAGTDSQFQLYTSGFSMERKNPDAAIAMWRNLDRNGLRFGYVVDVALGNAYQPGFFRTRTARPQDIARASDQILGHFEAAFRGNHLNSSIYKDLGDFYFRQFYPTEAWLLWDTGRDLDAKFGSRNNLESVDKFEIQLERKLPEFFLQP